MDMNLIHNLAILLECNDEEIMEIALSEFVKPYLNSENKLSFQKCKFIQHDKLNEGYLLDTLRFREVKYGKILFQRGVIYLPLDCVKEIEDKIYE